MLLFIIVGVAPKLLEAFKVLLPNAYKWRSIGILLDIEYSVLTRIKADNCSVDCLY